jgi:type II secretory pathway component PulK
MNRPVSKTRRRSVILIVVLVVVAILALSGYTFSELMLTHYEATIYAGRQVQTRALVNSGVDSARWFLTQPKDLQTDAGGVYDNPAMFQAQLVAPDMDPRYMGTFSILAPSLDSYGTLAGVRYGFEDESTRLNLNFLLLADKFQENGGRTLLLSLPGMTEEIADAILDWLDEDDDLREFGAEYDYYQTLEPPYTPTNGPFRSVEELLLVRGVTPDLMFGQDTNRNGMVDAHEMGVGAGMGAVPMSDSSANSAMGDMTRGWIPYLTLYGAEKNYNSLGFPRVFLNQKDLDLLYEELLTAVDEEWANFIVAYRLYGAYDGDEDGQSAVGFAPDTSQEPKADIGQVLELIDKKVQLPGDDGTVLVSPFSRDLLAMSFYLPELLDNCTVVSTSIIPGRLNINQAPAALLAGIPGMDEELYNAILEERITNPEESADNPNRRFETWILTEGFLFNEDGEPDITRMQQLSPFMCGGGDVYRAQVVGYFQGGGVSSRTEVVIDNTALTPSIVFWRDLTHLGRGYPLEVLGINLSGQIGQAF